MPPTHTVETVHPADTTSLGKNQSYRGLEWHPSIKSEYQLYLFNVSARSFDNFGLGKLGTKGMKVDGVRPDDPIDVTENGKVVPGHENEHYRYITSFPQPIMLTKPNLESNEFDFVPTDVRRYVIDMINPDNLTLSLDTVVPQDQVFSINNNYAMKGIFFSYTNPPEGKALRNAIDRMEAYYKHLLERAATLELTDKTKLSDELGSNPDYSYAANYFGKDVAWNRKQTRPVLCPNCGEQKQAGMKFHIASDGGLCVEPTVEAWQAVVNAGRRTYDQVPDSFRWPRTAVESLAKKLREQNQ